MRKDIIQSKTEPNKSDIWLSEEGLKKYGKDGWELLGGGVSPNTPIANEIQGDNLIPINQSGKNKAVSVEQIKNKVLELPSKYEFVDLGLPSGTKWATCNIGASKPEDFGLYFAWGETQGYSGITDTKKFEWSDYELCNGSDKTLTKYSSDSYYGIVDNLTTLELVDDAAYQSDNTCRIPTKSDFEELIANTNSTWETLNGVNGRRFTSKTNGNSIFVPAAGNCSNGSADNVGSNGNLWSSSINESFPINGWLLNLNSDNVNMFNEKRYNGLTVRPVQPSNIPTTINLKDLKDKVDNTEPYVWDGTTISETIFMELLTAIRSNREIILSQLTGLLSYRLISSAFMQDTLTLTFCEIVSAPNFLFTIYNITPNSVEFNTTSFYNKRDSSSTRLNTAYYNNLGLLTQDTKFTNKGTLSDLEYEGQFHFGDTVYAITFPSEIKWSTDSVLDYKPNHTYQFRIVRGFGVMKEFVNA